MSNRHYHSIDMTPEVRELEDGRLGYFYTPQQIEEVAWRELMDRVHNGYNRWGGQSQSDSIQEHENMISLENIVRKYNAQT